MTHEKMYNITIDGDSSLRSSVWKLKEKKWQILFHQGTKWLKKDKANL